MRITWSEADNAPCCAGVIVAEDGRELLIQTDWDYPAVAQTFGWRLRDCQPDCICPLRRTSAEPVPDNQHRDPDCKAHGESCRHDSTDGTVDCPDCGVTAHTFIQSAGAWLADNFGAEANDPGYFDAH